MQRNWKQRHGEAFNHEALEFQTIVIRGLTIALKVGFPAPRWNEWLVTGGAESPSHRSTGRPGTPALNRSHSARMKGMQGMGLQRGHQLAPQAHPRSGLRPSPIHSIPSILANECIQTSRQDSAADPAITETSGSRSLAPPLQSGHPRGTCEEPDLTEWPPSGIMEAW